MMIVIDDVVDSAGTQRASTREVDPSVEGARGDAAGGNRGESRRNRVELTGTGTGDKQATMDREREAASNPPGKSEEGGGEKKRGVALRLCHGAVGCIGAATYECR